MKKANIDAAKKLIAVMEFTQKLIDNVEACNVLCMGISRHDDLTDETFCKMDKDAESVGSRQVIAVGFNGDDPHFFTAKLFKDTILAELKKQLAKYEVELDALD